MSTEKKINAQDAAEEPRDRRKPAVDVSTFKFLYSSRDGGLIVFQDKDGHLTSVNANRLA